MTIYTKIFITFMSITVFLWGYAGSGTNFQVNLTLIHLQDTILEGGITPAYPKESQMENIQYLNHRSWSCQISTSPDSIIFLSKNIVYTDQHSDEDYICHNCIAVEALPQNYQHLCSFPEINLDFTAILYTSQQNIWYISFVSQW